jgi:hypothetical protein
MSTEAEAGDITDTDPTNISKEELVSYIKEWLQIEGELKKLLKLVKEKKDKKKNLTDNLVKVMKANEIDCFDTKTGKLLYTQNKTKTSLSQAYLLSTLTKYFGDDPSQASLVSKFIMENREIKIKEGIRFK